MSLFVCDECRCVENTATSKFWLRDGGPALCSECDPQMGRWHGLFDRREYDPEADKVAWVDGDWVR